jgi:DNA repair protein RadA/Sms
MRAERLGALGGDILLLTETNLFAIEEQILKIKPLMVIIDSIQTLYHPEVTSAAGSVSQVRECTASLLRLAKREGVAVFIVGHVTKEGNIAGPRVLEHMVDVVLYFEGEKHQSFRLLRGVKNRFGSTNEIGIFEMGEAGLLPVENPSALFLSERPLGKAGSVVVVTMEGRDSGTYKSEQLWGAKEDCNRC